MGLYNVVGPCYVAGWQHVRPTTEPIEVDDAEAAPLVDEGSLEPYQPGHAAGESRLAADDLSGVMAVHRAARQVAADVVIDPADDEPPTDPPPPRRPRGRGKG